ncbi:transposase, MuDR, MULE transposase domain protein [Tanacetum coccineum]
MKSATWHVYGVNHYQYQVSDGRYNREVDFQTRTCQCRKWQLSGIPCGHVIAVTRYLGMTDCVQFVADWFKKEKYQGTYAESIHFLGNIQEWEFPHHIQKAIPPKMDNPQPDRPKNTNQIKSQGEEPSFIHFSRCRQAGHRRDQCNKPIVVEPPVNTRTLNDKQFPRNDQPLFYNPHQQYDNTFQGLIPLPNAIQDRDMLLTYTQTHQNRLHMYVSRVEISPLVMVDQRKDERKQTKSRKTFLFKKGNGRDNLGAWICSLLIGFKNCDIVFNCLHTPTFQWFSFDGIANAGRDLETSMIK